MGRFSTSLAAKATHADNLPITLPNISALDTLLPQGIFRSEKKPKPLYPTPDNLHLSHGSAIGDAEIKRNRRGQLVMVRHKGSSIVDRGSSATGSAVITFEDIKKSVDKMKDQEGGGDKKSEKGSKEQGSADQDKVSKDGKKKSEKPDGNNDDAQEPTEKPVVDFTAEEEAKLRELKSAQPVKSWKEIAAEMTRNVEELKHHWKELQAADNGGDSKSNDAHKSGVIENQKGSEAKSKDKGQAKKGEAEPDGGQKQASGGGNQQTIDKFIFTEEQDKQLRECKSAGNNWKTIAKTLRKPQDACKKRWEEIGGESKQEDAKIETPSKEDNSTKIGGNKDEGKKDQAKPASGVKASSKAVSVAASVRSTRSSVKFSIREWRALQEDDFFSFDELQLLCQLIGKKGDQSWLFIASAFHDHTGRRVHPDDIRDKFEGIAR